MADTDEDQELAAAYQRLDEAISEVGRLEGYEGIITEWVVVNSAQNFDDEGNSVTCVGRMVPEGGGRVPYHHTMGLLDYALTQCRDEITS